MITAEAEMVTITEEDEFIEGIKAAYAAAEERGHAERFTIKGESV